MSAKTKKMGPIIFAGVFALAAIAFGVYAWVRMTSGGQERYRAAQVAPLGDQALFWLLRVGPEARLLRTDLEGRIQVEVRDRRGSLRLLAISGQSLFVHSGEQGLVLRSASTLEVTRNLEESFATHEILRRGYTPYGSVEGAVVLLGRDERHYRVDTQGAIERVEPEGVHQLPPPVEVQDIGIGDGDGSPSPLRPDRPPPSLRPLDLVQPRILTTWDRREPVGVGDPPDYLVVSSDIVGAGASDRLSRVAPDGRLAWTVAAEQMLKPTSLSGAPAFRVVWASAREDRLYVVVEARVGGRSESRGGWQAYDQRIAVLDPADGRVLRRSPLRTP